jgi:hypothetical protein
LIHEIPLAKVAVALSVLAFYSCTTVDDWEKIPRASFLAEVTGGSSLAEFRIKAISEDVDESST